MSRSYQQYCPVARALEHVGERWTVLVARELLLGPRRFTDLMAGLPGVSTNVLTLRLKELEQAGLVARRDLPPPASSTVYELTDAAAGLVSVVAAMADWGMGLLGRPRKRDDLRGSWLVLGLAATVTAPDVADGTVFELRTDDEVVHARVRDGHVEPERGPADDPDAVITASARTLAAVARGELTVSRGLAGGRIDIDGDRTASRRLLEAFVSSAA
ncbi:MAG: winged helix-turn-helix transcriptional regulator [Acidimicrobiia bacterium]